MSVPVINALLGLLGFGVAFYIFYKKRRKKPLVCPMRAHCESVIHSDYSKLFGVPLELYGMGYYGLVAGSYGMQVLFSVDVPDWGVMTVIILSVVAFLVSLYLIGVQALVLKNWCSWCVVSAAISTGIFVVSVWGIELLGVFL